MPDEHFMLVLADVHAGSLYAPYPYGMREPSWVPNDFQAFLNERMAGIFTWLSENGVKRLERLVLLGDTIHGEEAKSGGKYTVSPEPAHQVEAAFRLIGPFCEMADETILVSGTPYHESTMALEGLGSKLPRVQKAESGLYARQVVEGSWHGAFFNMAHHQTRGRGRIKLLCSPR
jgi:hypothetical protein